MKCTELQKRKSTVFRASNEAYKDGSMPDMNFEDDMTEIKGNEWLGDAI